MVRLSRTNVILSAVALTLAGLNVYQFSEGYKWERWENAREQQNYPLFLQALGQYAEMDGSSVEDNVSAKRPEFLNFPSSECVKLAPRVPSLGKSPLFCKKKNGENALVLVRDLRLNV